ncbi:MAG: methionyl-tRNA formyltransferase [Oscillospiraceae bacterium]|jgi:methionyl-tRNA formyltransferase|nr:methionyl-tRNA formyltransferase [Oscillospiraceae bacterium]
MSNIIIATTQKWNIENSKILAEILSNYNIIIYDDKDKLLYDDIIKANPEYIFFPHWSWKIPVDVYKNFTCIVFHMTDLPFGRGGSPLQNLISRGIYETKISAIEVVEEMDAGDVFLKESLSLFGGAEEIYVRASKIIFTKMIPYIVKHTPVAIKQIGEVVKFSRRTPEMSELSHDMTTNKLFDYIRMLDAEGYPKAYIKFGNYKLYFSRPKLTSNGLIADVEFEAEND